MALKSRSYFHSAVLRFGSTRPGAWLFARIAHPIDRPVLQLSRGRISVTNLLTGARIVKVTTTGARSGLPRTQPLMAIPDPQNPQSIVLIASNWGQRSNPAWYYNLKANPNAICNYDGQDAKYEAHEASGAEYERFWQIATSLYDNFAKYQQRNERRKIPIMVLTPLE